MGPGQPPIVSLPAIGALKPRVDILFCVGLTKVRIALLEICGDLLEPIDSNMCCWTADTATNVSTDTPETH